MNILLKILFIFAALFLTVLDVSFFSGLQIYGASLLISFVVLIIFALVGQQENWLVFSFGLIFSFAIFSSLPSIVLVINFFLVPAVINFVRRKYLPEPTLFSSISYFVVASLLFELMLVVYFREFDQQVALACSYFVVINSICGMILFGLYLKMRKKFVSSEIKF